MNKILQSSWFSTFLNDQLHHEKPVVQLRTKVFTSYFMIAVLIGVVCLGLNASVGLHDVFMMQLTPVCLAAFYLVYCKHRGVGPMAGDILTMSTLAAMIPFILYTTGVNAPAAAWFAILPMPVVLFNGIRRGLVWAFISVSLLLALYIAEQYQPIFPSSEVVHHGMFIDITGIVIAVVYLLFLVGASDFMRRESMAIANEEAHHNALMLQFTHEGVLKLSSSGQIQDLNPSAIKLLGESCQGAQVAALFPEWSPELERFDGVYQRPQLHDGQPKEFELSQHRLIDNSGGFVLMIHDVTARNQMVRTLESTRDDAVMANRAKTRFLAMMSHELRTPLNAIIGYTELLREELEETADPMVLGDLEKITGSGHHLLSVVGNILDLSKIESGQVEVYESQFTLRELIEDVVQPTQGLFYESEVAFVQRIGVSPNMKIYTDRSKVRQVLINLIGNAAKFTERGSVTFAVWQNAQATHLCFDIIDTGPGIDPKVQAKIFEPFQQLDHSTTRSHDGSGLGLAISHQFATLCGAQLVLDSEPGQGSCFRMRLPLNKATAHVGVVTLH